jgi:hypothetical protein
MYAWIVSECAHGHYERKKRKEKEKEKVVS